MHFVPESFKDQACIFRLKFKFRDFPLQQKLTRLHTRMLPEAAHDGRTQAMRCAMNWQVEEAGDRGVRFWPRGRMPQARVAAGPSRAAEPRVACALHAERPRARMSYARADFGFLCLGADLLCIAGPWQSPAFQAPACARAEALHAHLAGLLGWQKEVCVPRLRGLAAEGGGGREVRG